MVGKVATVKAPMSSMPIKTLKLDKYQFDKAVNHRQPIREGSLVGASISVLIAPFSNHFPYDFLATLFH